MAQPLDLGMIGFEAESNGFDILPVIGYTGVTIEYVLSGTSRNECYEAFVFVVWEGSGTSQRCAFCFAPERTGFVYPT